MALRLDTLATDIDVAGRRLTVQNPGGVVSELPYDALVIGTGAVSARPSIAGLTGPDAVGPHDGVHLLHSMGDTFAVAESIKNRQPKTAVVIDAGYIGLEMAESLTTLGIQVTQIEALPEVLPTVDPHLGRLVHTELGTHGVLVHTSTAVNSISRHPTGALKVDASGPTGQLTRTVDLVQVVVGVRPDTALAAADDLGAVPGRDVQRHPAPPAIHVQQPHPRAQRELAGDEVVFRGLRLFQGQTGTFPHPAGIGHRRAQHDAVERVGHVVVVRDGGRVPPFAVPPAAWSRLLRRRRQAEPPPPRGTVQVQQPRRGEQIGRPQPQVRAGVAQFRTSKIVPRSMSRSPATYARAMPSSPGRVNTRRIASADRTRSTVRAPTGPSAEPS